MLGSQFLAIVACALLQFLAGGAVYGYTALVPILIDQGAFANTCGSDPRPCGKQWTLLNSAFTVSLSLLCVFALISGHFMDCYGPSRTVLLGAGATGVGTIVLMAASATATPVAADVLWYIGLVVWGSSAPFIMNPILTLPKALVMMDPRTDGTKYSGWATALVIAFFDASSGTFTLFKVVYEHTNATWIQICGGYLACVSLLGGVCAGLLPGPPSLANLSEGDGLAVLPETPVKPIDSIRPHATSSAYIGLCTLMSVVVLRNVFYIGSFLNQMTIVFGSHASDVPELVFNVVFPAGGFVGGLVSTVVLKLVKQRDDVLFWLVWASTTLHGIFNCIETLTCQYIAIALFPISRCLLWTACCDFLARHYPFNAFGRLLGIINIVIGVLSLVSIPLYDVSIKLRMGQGNFLPVNVAITVLQGCCVVVPLYMTHTHRRERTQPLSSLELAATPVVS